MKTDHYAARQRLIVGLAYVLHILLIPAILGAIINVLKIREYDKPAPSRDNGQREDAKLFESHHKWLLNTFLIALFFMAAGYGTMYWGVGYALVIGASAWWIYRMLRGIVMFAANKPMPIWDDVDPTKSRNALISHSP
jgi:uncharacterized membrane protein